ncbi:MAG: hypothetical protein R2748_18335 [Bryobacterales bacterium]
MPTSLPIEERLIRVAVFFTVLVVMVGWELVQPRRRREIPRLLRWTGNPGSS